jgi:hypothetical protein
MRYTQMKQVTGGESFTTGAQNKGILLSGDDTVFNGTDKYGNTFTINHDARAGSAIYPIAINTCAGVTFTAASGGAYVLF